MPAKQPPMVCKACGTTMVHHADKPSYPESAEEAKRMDPRLGVLIVEIHGCPNCGRCDSRPG